VRPFDNSAPNSISIGGAPSTRNEVLLNGAPNAGFSNQMAYSPPRDAVVEVRTNTFQMDASYGHTMGGTVNLVTKGGTNDLHGVAYIFNQTSAVDANSFFNNARAVPRPPYHQNQYGVNGGGPLFLPKVYNGKNKVFWYVGWEGMRDSDPANSPLETGNPVNFTSVPTAAERTGDFSALLTVNQINPADKNNYTIYDPNTGVMSGNNVARTPFPNNVIPSNRINEISQNYLTYFPLPNTPGQANGLQNFIINAVDSDGYDNEIGRMDVNLSATNRLSFDAHHNYRAQNKNNFRQCRNRDLGFPSYLAANAGFLTMPYLVFNSTSVAAGARAGFEPLGYNGDGTNYSDIFQIFGNVVKIRGNHTMKAGLDVRAYHYSLYTFGNPSGTYTFNGNFTNNPAVSNSTVFGQEMATFLLAVRLMINTQLDYIPAQYLSKSLIRDNTVINALSGSTPNPFKGLVPTGTLATATTVATQQLLTPFPQYLVPSPPSSTSNGIVMQGNNAGSSF